MVVAGYYTFGGVFQSLYAFVAEYAGGLRCAGQRRYRGGIRWLGCGGQHGFRSDERDIQLDPIDAKVEDIKSCQVGETTLLLSGSKTYIASPTKARDYYVFTFMPVSSCLGEVGGPVVWSRCIASCRRVPAFSRRKSEHEHLHQLVLQEHEYADRLAMSAHQAQSANRAKTEFLQRMSHDIRIAHKRHPRHGGNRQCL